MNIHPTAIIDPQVKLDSSVKVGPYAVISGEVTLFEQVEIGAFTHISGKTSIGANTVIDCHASIGGAPQDKKTFQSDAALVIGKNNHIREFVTINRGEKTTEIGDCNWLMAYSHIAHDCIIGNDCTFSNGVTLGGHVIVGDGVNFGGLSAVHQWCRIGDGAMVAGGSMVVQDVPPYCLAHGNRAVLVGLNRIGLRRKGVTSAEIDQLYAAYKSLFSSNANFKTAIPAGQAQLTSASPLTLRHFWTFFEHTKRGYCKGRKRQ